jgi:probable F420-dependent oxidoreductase
VEVGLEPIISVKEKPMATSRPFRFGVLAMEETSSRDAWVSYARKVEDLGYSTLTMGEHISFGDLAPFPALMAAADATTRLRVGTHVVVNDFRNPVLLAQEVATLDLLAEGRLEFGIGAGWLAADFLATGIPFAPARTRVQRLEEAVSLLKRLFRDGPVTFEGAYYSVQDMDLTIKPQQRPHPPLYVGGGGNQVLSFAAREADIVGVSSKATAAGAIDLGDRTPQAFDEKVAWIRDAAEERFPQLELNTLIQHVRITNNRRQAVEEILAAYANWPPGLVVNVPQRAEELLEAPFCLIGTVGQIVEQLQERRERYGISYITIHGGYTDALAPVIERLAGT